MTPSTLNRKRSTPLPFVLVNMAMTADGKIATANRRVSTFGSRRDRDHLLELRATADALIAGARTVDSRAVNMGPGPAKYRRLRLRRGLAEYNLRIIVSGCATLNPNAEVFRHKFSPIILLTTQRAPASRLRKLRAQGAQIRICGKEHINFKAALHWLRRKWRVRTLLCEGGGELNDALLRAGVVDQLHLTICPRVCGGRAAPTIADGRGFGSLARATRLVLQSARRYGEESFLVYRVLKRGK